MSNRSRWATVLAFGALVLALLAPSGASASGRITGGTKVGRDAYDARWRAVVSLRVGIDGDEVLDAVTDADDVSGARENHICGGTLIRADIVVTAAHCMGELREFRLVGSRMRVLVGTRTLLDGKTQPGKLYDVSSYRIHPGWEGADDDFYFDEGGLGNDVAVLKLATPVTGITPMELVGPGDRAAWGGGAGLASGALVAGWGVTNALFDEVDDEVADDTQHDLREVSLPLLADGDCESTSGPVGGEASAFDAATMLCGFRRNTDRRPDHSNRAGPCYGDSGGPLTVPVADGTRRLAGIVSWGPDTGGGCNRASVFTRVDAMRPWIETAIAELEAPAGTSSISAPTITSAAANGPSSIRVAWDGVPGATRYQLYYEYRPYRNIREAIREARESDDSDDKPLDPKVISFLEHLRMLIPDASGGADTRSVVMRGVRPRRAGTAGKLRVHIEVRDDQGHATLSPAIAVDMPVDAHAPRAAKAPSVRVNRAGTPTLTWPPVFDDDCVERYVVLAQPASGGSWRRLTSEHAYQCGEDADDGFDVRRLPSEPYSVVPYGLKAGTWRIRVAAYDRAGNRSLGGVRRLTVARRVAHAARECESFGPFTRCVIRRNGEIVGESVSSRDTSLSVR